MNPRMVLESHGIGGELVGFNGAAGVNPRMAQFGTEAGDGADGLQWGRGCEPADGSRSPVATRSSGASFNGAAGVNPRMDVINTPWRSEVPRFNGAAGVNPRMAFCEAPGSSPLALLQWGRGCEPADGSR